MTPFDQLQQEVVRPGTGTGVRPPDEGGDRVRLRDRCRRLVPGYRNQLVRTGHLLTLSSLLTSVIGAVYWMVATRVYGAATVGTSYAAVSAMVFLATFGQLNLANVLIRFLPSAGQGSRRLVTITYVAAIGVTLMVSVGFVLLVPTLTPGLAFLHSPLIGAAFVVGSVAYAIFALQDGALTGLRRPGWIVVENALFALAKIMLIVILAAGMLRSQGILASWIIALIAATVVTNGYLYRRLSAIARGHAPQQDRARLRIASSTTRYIAADYIGQMFWTGSISLPSIMVLDRLGAVASAYYSLSSFIASALFMFSTNMGLSFVVESAREPGDDARLRLRHLIRHTASVLGACVALTVVGAPLILRLYGAEYEHGSTGLLQLMALSALPNMVLAVAVSVARSQLRMKFVTVTYVAQFVMLIGLTAVLLPVMGVSGVGVAWLVSLTVVALALLARRDLWLTRRRS
jgi:O-antigen/teichoic acid export membrane protein